VHRSLLALLLTVLVPAPAALAVEVVDRIVVVVNDDLILDSEVDSEFELVMRAEQISFPEGPSGLEQRQEMREMLVEGLIGRKLMDQAMVRLGIVVDETEVESQLSEYARANNMNSDQFLQELARQGITADEFRADLREQMAQYRLFQAEIGTRIEVTEDMLLQRYRERSGGQLNDPEYHLRVIVLHLPEVVTEEIVAETRALADSIRADVAAGGSFEDLAREHCTDPAIASKGGDFGKVRPRSMIPEWREAVEGLPINQVSEPFEFRGALWLIQVYRITDAAASSFEAVHDQLFDELYREQEEREIELWVEREKSKAHIEYLH
jgi:peptidyl-prolyl cis-trans isomerase SurA